MTNLIVCLLALLFSLSGPAMKGNADFWQSSFAAEGGGQQVFRVINDAEKAAIQNSGKFEFLPTGSTPTGQPGKFFWSSMDEAKQFQQYWYRGGENSHIVSTTLGPNATPTLFPNTDGIGTAIWAPLKDLTAPIVHH